MASSFFLAKPPPKLLPEALAAPQRRELVDQASRETVTRAIPGMFAYAVGGALIAATTPMLQHHPAVFIPLLAGNLAIAVIRVIHARRFDRLFAARAPESAFWF